MNKGDIFGELTVKRQADDRHYVCECSCGNETLAHINNLLDGSILSCGHIQNTVINITGQQFGKWYVDSYAGNRKWNVICGCGKRDIKDGGKLRNGYTRSCKACSRLIDLTGQLFGELHVIRYLGNREWECECSCGNKIKVAGGDLKSGHTKSCGHNTTGFKNLVDEEFGELIATKYKGDGVWECRCSCGNIVDIHRTRLLNGHTKSCGCKSDAFRKITMFERYGDTHSTHILYPREIDQIEALMYEEKLLGTILEFNHKPSIAELCLKLNVKKSALLKAVHRFELEEYVQIGSNKSMFELELLEIINDINSDIEVIHCDRAVLDGAELDIYIPSKKLAIEFNGNYYHSSEHKDVRYHQNKTIKCSNSGIHLIHIFEYEWEDDDIQRKIVDYIKSILTDDPKINIRDTEVTELENCVGRKFLDKHSLDTCNDYAGIKYIGLKHKDTLLGALEFRHSNIDNSLEIIRTAYIYNIDRQLAFRSMHTYIVSKYRPRYIKCSINASKNTYAEFVNVGFTVDSISEPESIMIKNNGHRLRDATSCENVDHSKYFQIYDCGKYKLSLVCT